jgi:hypothetical protein
MRDNEKKNATLILILNKIDMSHCFVDDTCVTEAEYTATSLAHAPEVATKLFHFLDHDKDQCLTIPDMQADYHMVDHNSK